MASSFVYSFIKRVQSWAGSAFAPYCLAALSFFEAFIMPYPPPDVLLAPMVLGRPRRAYFFVWVATFFSLLGGLVGYVLGYFFYGWFEPYLLKVVTSKTLEQTQMIFVAYGAWIVLIGGFSPFPYKIVNVVAGASMMPIALFSFFSLISRGARFLLVSFLVRRYGERFLHTLNNGVIDKWIGGCLLLLLASWGVFQFF